jgi:hypothetical protein
MGGRAAAGLGAAGETFGASVGGVTDGFEIGGGGGGGGEATAGFASTTGAGGGGGAA